VAGQGDRRQPQARGPPLGPLVQQRDPGLGQRDARGLQQLAGLLLGKAQVRRADLGQLAGQPQLVQAQPHIVTRGQDRVHARGKVHRQPGQLGERFRRGQLVQIINNQRDATGTSASSDSTPVGYRRRIVVRRRCRRSAPLPAPAACRTASSRASQNCWTSAGKLPEPPSKACLDIYA
jgi:hypothetical protein